MYDLCDANSIVQGKVTPLMWAVKKEYEPSLAVVKVLLKGKANVNATSKVSVWGMNVCV